MFGGFFLKHPATHYFSSSLKFVYWETICISLMVMIYYYVFVFVMLSYVCYVALLCIFMHLIIYLIIFDH